MVVNMVSMSLEFWRPRNQHLQKHCQAKRVKSDVGIDGNSKYWNGCVLSRTWESRWRELLVWTKNVFSNIGAWFLNKS